MVWAVYYSMKVIWIVVWVVVYLVVWVVVCVVVWAVVWVVVWVVVCVVVHVLVCTLHINNKHSVISTYAWRTYVPASQPLYRLGEQLIK